MMELIIAQKIVVSDLDLHIRKKTTIEKTTYQKNQQIQNQQKKTCTPKKTA